MPGHRPNIVVIGSANIDLVTRVQRSPQPGESMFGKSFHTVSGGKGANQAIAAARLGAGVSFGGCVGDDPFGAMQRSSLEAAGVATPHLLSHPEHATGTALIIVDDDGQNSIIVNRAANLAFTPAHVEAMETLISQADALLLQLEIPLETVERALEIANKHGVLSVLDAGPAQALDDSLIAKADILSPNETEAQAITGLLVHDHASAVQVADALHGRGAREVVLKLGARGAYYSGADKIHIPAHPVQAVDTTAAGDVFTAALAIAWPQGVESALRFATAAAAISVTRAGAQPSIPTLAEVEVFLAKLP